MVNFYRRRFDRDFTAHGHDFCSAVKYEGRNVEKRAKKKPEHEKGIKSERERKRAPDVEKY